MKSMQHATMYRRRKSKPSIKYREFSLHLWHHVATADIESALSKNRKKNMKKPNLVAIQNSTRRAMDSVHRSIVDLIS